MRERESERACVYVCVETEECVCGEAGPSFLELDGKHHGGFTEFGTAGKLCGMDTGTACTEPAFGRSSQTRKKKNPQLNREKMSKVC